MFNPGIAHRQQRVLRRHMQWLDFMARAACSHAHWLPNAQTRSRHYELAMRDWYRAAAGRHEARTGKLGAAARPDARAGPQGAFPDLLRAALPGDTVLSIDLPGNGQAQRHRKPDTG